MRLLFLLAILLGGTFVGAAETDGGEGAPFRVEDVITDSVAKLKPPRWYPELVTMKIAITAKSPVVQKHVTHGTALIHAGWDFEAYRHFVEAVKADPECAMAYWGISLALANPNSELVAERLAAVERMLELVRLGKTTPVEQGQIESLSFLFSPERHRAPEIYELVAQEFPNNIQLALMSAFMKRDGYDALFGPGPGQKQALREVADLLRENPESQTALTFWIALHTEHPDGTGEIRKVVLPRVRDLAKLAPDFAPYRELIGHFEWRAGNLQLARQEFQQAVALYQRYLTEEGLEYYDCPNFIRAQLYLATAYKSLGNYPKAFEIAEALRQLPLAAERIGSAGATLNLWEGLTLGPRLHLAQNDLQAAIEALPEKEVGKELSLRTPAVMAWEGWRELFLARLALAAKDYDQATKNLLGVAASDALLESAKVVVAIGSGGAELARMRQGLKVEWMVTKALDKAARSESGGDAQAEFWFQSAVDEQVPALGTYPPLLLSSPRLVFADYLSNKGDIEKARALYKMAMRAAPNDVDVLRAYVRFQKLQGEDASAAEMLKHIKLVTGS